MRGSDVYIIKTWSKKWPEGWGERDEDSDRSSTTHPTKTALTGQTNFSRIKAFQIVEHISVGQKDPSPGPLGREPAGDGAPSTMLVKAHVTMPADTTTFLGVCLVAQWCPALCNPVNCSLPGSSVNRILQARILKWIALSFFKGILAARFFTKVPPIFLWLYLNKITDSWVSPSPLLNDPDQHS